MPATTLVAQSGDLHAATGVLRVLQRDDAHGALNHAAQRPGLAAAAVAAHLDRSHAVLVAIPAGVS